MSVLKSDEHAAGQVAAVRVPGTGAKLTWLTTPAAHPSSATWVRRPSLDADRAWLPAAPRMASCPTPPAARSLISARDPITTLGQAQHLDVHAALRHHPAHRSMHPLCHVPSGMDREPLATILDMCPRSPAASRPSPRPITLQQLEHAPPHQTNPAHLTLDPKHDATPAPDSAARTPEPTNLT